jgi:phytoene dehydrogenase-like protein
MTTHDIVVVGGGHNMMAAAAYLAKAGFDVGVYEARDFLGGGVITREPVLPGFKMETNSVWHGMIRLNPMLAHNELELETKYGLEYLEPDIVYGNIFIDGLDFCIYSDVDQTCESIARFSQHDADAYRKFTEYSVGMTRFLANNLYAPPTPWGQTQMMLDSSPQGQRILRIMMSSPLQIVNEWFEDDHVKIALMKIANEAMAFPWAVDSGIAVYTMCGLTHLELPRGGHPYGTPRGGGAEVSLSLQRCLEDMGGSVTLNAHVNKILVEGGKAVGVQLDSGEKIAATKAVLCGANARRVFADGGLLDEETPDEIKTRIAALRDDDHSTLVSNYALKERPKYKVGGELDRAGLIELLPMMDDFLMHYFDCLRGKVADTPVLYTACHDIVDPTKSPDGQASIQVYDPQPYWLQGGPERWDDIKEEVEDKKLAWVREFTTNMDDDNILGRVVTSPLDLERQSEAYVHGNISSLGRGFPQYSANRPLPELGQYRVPFVGQLYIGGPSTHSGGGVSGGAGRAVAQRIMEDFDIDFDKVVG